MDLKTLPLYLIALCLIAFVGAVYIELTKKKQLSSFHLLIVAIILIGMISIRYTLDPEFKTTNFKPEQFGQLGDFFGGILNPTFGFITILLLLHTVNLQKGDMQRDQNIRNIESTFRLLESSKIKYESSLEKPELHDPTKYEYFSLKSLHVFTVETAKHMANRRRAISNEITVMLRKQNFREIDDGNEMFLTAVRASQLFVIKHYKKLIELEDFDYARADLATQMYEFMEQNLKYKLLKKKEIKEIERIFFMHTKIHAYFN